MTDLIKPEPPPKPTAGTPVWDLVIADMKARDDFGRKKYGTPLQTTNGRDALTDAYQEALDLCVYLRQAIEERKTAKSCAAIVESPSGTVSPKGYPHGTKMVTLSSSCRSFGP